jgi:hypothetical protein
MTDDEAVVVATLIELREDLAHLLCVRVNSQCRTHRFTVQTAGTARLYVRVQALTEAQGGTTE